MTKTKTKIRAKKGDGVRGWRIVLQALFYTTRIDLLFSEMDSDNTDSMWISRSLAKQDRWSSYEWTSEGEMEGARGLLPSLPEYVLRENDEWFIMWIKSQFILDPDQVAALLEEKQALALIRLIAEVEAEEKASEVMAAEFYASLQRAEERAEEGAAAIHAADAARDALLAKVYTGPEAAVRAEMVRTHNELLAHGAFVAAKHYEIAITQFDRFHA